MKNKKMRGVMSVAALLLALLSPCAAAYGQSDGPFSNANGKSDVFFSNAGGVRDGNNVSWNDINSFGNGVSWNGVSFGNNGGSWNGINGGGDGAAWNGMEDETPVGGGLLVLALSGVCYAGAKVKRLKIKE